MGDQKVKYCEYLQEDRKKNHCRLERQKNALVNEVGIRTGFIRNDGKYLFRGLNINSGETLEIIHINTKP